MSTPIVNPPQSAILGMHKIQERPTVVDGQVVARPLLGVTLAKAHTRADWAKRPLSAEQVGRIVHQAEQRCRDVSPLYKGTDKAA